MAAGQCFMFLLWCETTMRDLVVLKEGGKGMRRSYSRAFGKDSHPSDFSRRRLDFGTRDFIEIKDRFLCHWPKWKDHREVRDAIERVVIWRNALGHANVQPFRNHLLYTPREAAWKRIRNYARCSQCYRYHEECSCRHDNLAEPQSIVVKNETLRTVFEDIRTVDVECFYPTAIILNVEYCGVAWPDKDGSYILKEHHYAPS